MAAPRVHDPLELCHVIGVKIWVNICPPSFLIVRPMRKLLRPIPSAVLSIRTFSALKNGFLWNIKCRRTDLTCQRLLFVKPRAWRFDSDSINEKNFHLLEYFLLSERSSTYFSLKKPKRLRPQAQEIFPVLWFQPQKLKTVSVFFIIFEFLIDWSVLFVDSELPFMISWICDDCLWVFLTILETFPLFDPFLGRLCMFYA